MKWSIPWFVVLQTEAGRISFKVGNWQTFAYESDESSNSMGSVNLLILKQHTHTYIIKLLQVQYVGKHMHADTFEAQMEVASEK